jgi:hypothetical protein
MRDLDEGPGTPGNQITTLQSLFSGGTDEMILASDYSATTGRTVGAFRDLVGGLGLPRSIWETLPPPLGDELTMGAKDYVDRWMRDVERIGSTVYAVLGYCVGCVYAAALADRIEQRQGAAPRLILFDPETPSPALLLRHYRDGVGVIAAVATPAEVAEAELAGAEAAATEQRMGPLADRLCALLVGLGETAFTRAGLSRARRHELLGTFTSFLRYLVAASELSPGARWAIATALTSATPGNGLNALTDRERADAVAREIRFDVGHAELLRTDAVAQATVDLLS